MHVCAFIFVPVNLCRLVAKHNAGHMLIYFSALVSLQVCQTQEQKEWYDEIMINSVLREFSSNSSQVYREHFMQDFQSFAASGDPVVCSKIGELLKTQSEDMHVARDCHGSFIVSMCACA